jgi:hypothetical protein
MKPNDEEKVEEELEKDKEREKKPYTSPTLKVHGDVEEITNVLRKAGVKSTKGSIFDDE